MQIISKSEESEARHITLGGNVLLLTFPNDCQSCCILQWVLFLSGEVVGNTVTLVTIPSTPMQSMDKIVFHALWLNMQCFYFMSTKVSR